MEKDIENIVKFPAPETHVLVKKDFIQSKSDSLTKISPVSSNSVSTITDSDDEDSLHHLKTALTKLETKCRVLEIDNESLRTNLTDQQRKNEKLEKKLIFVKENQEIFMKLKEAYINMKYNESVGKKMKEIQEKGMQTWDGVLCAGCLEAEEIRTEARNYIEKYKNCFLIPNETLSDLGTTLNYLRDVVEKREKSWSLNMEREMKLRSHIEALEKENNELKELIKARAASEQDSTSHKKELEQLKSIVIKYERKLKEFNENISKSTKKIRTPLNTTEEDLVRRLSLKKVRSRSKSMDPSKRPQIDTKTGNPLSMLDTLFNSDSFMDI